MHQASSRSAKKRAALCGAGAVGYLMILLLLRLLTTLWLNLRVQGSSLSNPAGLGLVQAELIALALQIAALMLSGLVLCRLTGMQPFAVLKKAPVCRWKKPLLPVALGWLMLASVIGQALRGLGGFSAQEVSLSRGGVPLLIEFCSICLVPAVGEEWLFRGVLQRLLRPFGGGAAILASSLLFGLLHGEPGQCLTAFLCGLMLGFLAERTESLWPGILMHLCNNCIAFAGGWLVCYGSGNGAALFQLPLLIGFPLWGAVSLIRTAKTKRRLPGTQLRMGFGPGVLFGSPIFDLCLAVLTGWLALNTAGIF